MRLRLLILCSIFLLAYSQIETRQSQGKKGKFFVHALHSASFFKTTVPVKWSATMKGRPSLPQWLHLVPSQRHEALAYLIGTPVTPLRQMTVHVIAKSLHSDEIKQQFIVINLTEDSKYSSATTQVLDLYIRNYDAESLISDRSGLIGKLEAAAKETFVGAQVYPYIFNIKPSADIHGLRQHLFDRHKPGAIVQIGTQKGFYKNLHDMVRTLRNKPMFCVRNEHVPIDKKFQNSFDIDWCRTQVHVISKGNQEKFERQSHGSTESARPKFSEALLTTTTMTSEILAPVDGYSFWDSILALPVFGMAVIVILLILVVIFFGCREGQQWRDYKTPKEQLEEYVSVRDSQRHLRELSVQRQLLLMSNDRENSQAPSGIHSFLRPKSRTSSVQHLPPRLPRHYKSASRINDNTSEMLGSGMEMVPVGKQTVAEAAKQCGSSLHLYRNPLDSNSDPDHENEENDSLEEQPTGRY